MPTVDVLLQQCLVAVRVKVRGMKLFQGHWEVVRIAVYHGVTSMAVHLGLPTMLTSMKWAVLVMISVDDPDYVYDESMSNDDSAQDEDLDIASGGDRDVNVEESVASGGSGEGSGGGDGGVGDDATGRCKRAPRTSVRKKDLFMLGRYKSGLKMWPKRSVIWVTVTLVIPPRKMWRHARWELHAVMGDLIRSGEKQ